ncbi:MAG: hypothetical protein FE78DRAFT_393757 [Acidomyces sp. 'richmondensis']|nr:MAG: hypothetical protein FE78DRAFT_393757 [Acidomyces sp. 'richmondensis']
MFRNRLLASEKSRCCISHKLLVQLLVQLLMYSDVATLSAWIVLHALMQALGPAHSSPFSVGARFEYLQGSFVMSNRRAGRQYGNLHCSNAQVNLKCCDLTSISCILTVSYHFRYQWASLGG